MIGTNMLRLFGADPTDIGSKTPVDNEEMAWREMPFVSHFMDGTICHWSPPLVEAQDTDEWTDMRLADTQRAIGEAFGVRLIAHMRRHGTVAQGRLKQVIETMHERRNCTAIESGFLSVISSYIANEGMMAIAGGVAEIRTGT